MLSINISELIWGIVNFFLMMFLLNKFLYKPVLKFMEERQARIDAGENAGRQAESDERLCEAELEKALEDKHAEAKKIIAEGKRTDEKVRAEALTSARHDAAAIRQKLKSQVTDRSEEEKKQLDSMQDELAGRLAEKLLGIELK